MFSFGLNLCPADNRPDNCEVCAWRLQLLKVAYTENNSTGVREINSLPSEFDYVASAPATPISMLGGRDFASGKSCEINAASCARHVCASVKSCEIEAACCVRMGRNRATLI